MTTKKKICLFLICIAFVFAVVFAINSIRFPSVVREVGTVPDEQTAIRIAEAVWLPIYGDVIYEELPFEAKLIPFVKIWYVHGSIPEDQIGLTVGGVVEIGIRQSDGKIIFVRHEK